MPDAAGSLLSVGYGIGAVAHLALVAWLRAGPRRLPLERRARALLIGALLASAAWCAAGLLDEHSTQRWTWHAAIALDGLRYALWCALLAWLIAGGSVRDAGVPGGEAVTRPAALRSAASTPPTDRSRLGAAPRWPWLGIAALVAATAGVDLVTGVLPATTPWAFRAAAWVQLGWSVFGLLLVEQLYRSQPETSRWGVKALCLTVGILCMFDVYGLAQALMFGTPNLDASVARPVVHALTVPLLWRSARHAQLTKPQPLRLSKAAAFYSASLLLVGLYLVFVAAAGYWVRLAGGSWGGALQVTVAFAAIAALGVLATSGEVRARLRVQLAKNFLGYRYDYRVEWLRFTALTSHGDGAPQEVGDRVLRGLADMVEATGGSLWLRGLGDEALTQRVRLNMPPIDTVLHDDDALLRFMARMEWVVDVPALLRGEPLPDAHSGAGARAEADRAALAAARPRASRHAPLSAMASEEPDGPARARADAGDREGTAGSDDDDADTDTDTDEADDDDEGAGAAGAAGATEPVAPVAPAWLAALSGAWVMLPLLAGRQLVGIVVLTRPRAPVELDWEVRDLLKTAARQGAAFLAQLQATEALLEARKFDAFHRMSAFVVHDLKNIVTQLSLMLKNAQRHRDNPEFQQDMLATVESSLDKMRQLMLQLREGARPTGTGAGVELATLVERIRQDAARRGRRLEVEVPPGLSTRGHHERLERVIGHLVHNAIDATPPQGRVWVRVRQDAGRVLLEVGDTGSGMSPEFVRTRLFRPFASTKASGMGIGSYESRQYVRELGGTLDVDSAPGRGTCITMALPLLDVRTASDLTLTASP